MCLPMWAHWRHLENTIELVLPSAYPSPQSKRQIDRFSRSCIAHGRKSYTYNGLFFPTKFPFPWGIWAPSNIWFPRTTRVLNPNGISIGSAVFAGLTSVTDRQTDRRTYRQTDKPTDHATRSVSIDRSHRTSTINHLGCFSWNTM